MKILLFGASGMLGRELVSYLNQYSNIEIIKARKSDCDINKIEQIETFIEEIKPNVIINSAAIIDLKLCEKEKDYVFAINSLSASRMAFAANKIGAKLVQISTDHYYSGDGEKKHTENDSVSLLNYYAYTKFIGENYTMLARKNLIIRTNIVGFKMEQGQETFIEWAIRSLENDDQLNLFEDYFVSSIDIYSFSKILKKMIDRDARGLYNVSSCEVTSKANFIHLLSLKLNIPLNKPKYVSVNSLESSLVKRANSLGLDVRKIEKNLGIEMPKIDQVISNICEVYHGFKTDFK
jgi:dTDP-4-dehydrorhamnose reductase